MASSDVYGGVWVRPRCLSMRLSSILMDSISFFNQSSYPTSYPSSTFCYIKESSFWTEIGFTSGVENSCPPACSARRGFEFYLGRWGIPVWRLVRYLKSGRGFLVGTCRCGSLVFCRLGTTPQYMFHNMLSCWRMFQ